MTDVDLEVRVAVLEENTGGKSQNGNSFKGEPNFNERLSRKSVHENRENICDKAKIN